MPLRSLTGKIGFNLYNSVFGLNLGNRFTPTNKDECGSEKAGRGRAERGREVEEEKRTGGQSDVYFSSSSPRSNFFPPRRPPRERREGERANRIQ
jgi:hypothetical protein